LLERNNYGYNYGRCVVAAITAAFQFILILTVSNEPIPYLLSNVSILGGYILDIIVIIYEYPTLRKLIISELWIESIAVVLALSDVLYISVYCTGESLCQFAKYFSHLSVPIITLISLFYYLVLNLIITIKNRKDVDAFILK